MRFTHSSYATRGDADAQQPPGFRVCLSISGLHCASKGAPLERALRRIEGIWDATVNPLRDRVSVVADALTRIDAVIQVLAARGYPVDPGDIGVTAWLNGVERLRELERELLATPAVTSYKITEATGRLELRLTLNPGWEADLRAVCNQLCSAAAAREVTSETPVGERGTKIQRNTGDRVQSATEQRDR